MTKIGVWGSLRDATGGQAEIEIEARNVKELLEKLTASYPGAKPAIERGVSVVINGRVYGNALLAEIKPDSEVYLMPRLRGG